MTESILTVVIGAGAVGLAVARALTVAGQEVIILEAEAAIGTGISSRNSEVIHAGIYYPPRSLKAKLCVAGRQLLYQYCAERGIAHQQCGKLIVATEPAQLPALEILRQKGAGNGVHDLRLLDAKTVTEMEPALRNAGALYSPSSGIVDSHALMLALQGDFEAAGGTIAFRTPVMSVTCEPDGFTIQTGGAHASLIKSRYLINSAGLQAGAIAAIIKGMPPSHIPRHYFAKGNYFSLSQKVPFTHLIYPLPEPGGLGVHLTLDMAGRGRFGPDVEWIDALDYDVDPSRAEKFYAAIRRYWPALADGALQADYAGIRPKLAAPGAPDADFAISGPAHHGVHGLVHLFGIESPGLTACLALADTIKYELSAF